MITRRPPSKPSRSATPLERHSNPAIPFTTTWPHPRAWLRLAVLLLAWPLLACSSHTDGAGTDRPPAAVQDPQDPDFGTSDPSASPNTGSPTTSIGPNAPFDLGEEARLDYCAGSGPPVEFQSGATQGSATACGRSVTGELFRFGLCACQDATFTGAFEIDAFDSSKGPSSAGQLLASVGVNDDLVTSGILDIRGSLVAAGGGVTPIVAANYNIDGNYFTNADLMISGANVRFGRDLWVNGDILTLGFAKVRGDVHQTPGHELSGMTVDGQVLKQDFIVPPPCPCGVDDILDIDAIVRAAKAHSHNAEVGLDNGNTISLGVGQPMLLDCGRYTFESAHFAGLGQLRAYGRTALFVDGDLTLTGAFGIDLGDTGELDVFVTGNLVLTGTGDIGSVDRPAALRFYVGGGGDISIAGATRFSANVYAPRSHVVVTGVEDIYGAFFVSSYTVTGTQRMHYDSAILNVGGNGERCDPPSGCEDDLNCTAPSVCRDGRCIPLTDGPL